MMSQQQQQHHKKKIIIDTDCGGDDIVGIMTAVADPDVEVVALSAVWGNVNVDQGIRNLSTVVDALGLDIPIFVGAAGPMLGGERETVQWYGFGDDGMGDAGFPVSPRAEWARKKPHAALALVEILSNIADDDPATWQVYAIGPLTNLAIALQLSPDLFRKLGSLERGEPGLIMMGGAMYGKGNANLTAEFNFACDPEAACVVFNNRSLRMPIAVVSWELTVDAAVPWEMFDRMLGRPLRHISALSRQASTSSGVEALAPLWLEELSLTEKNEHIGAFLGKILRKFEETSRPKEVDLDDDAERTQDSCVICDAVAIAVGLNAGLLVKDRMRTFATVETRGQYSRGMLCTSWYGNQKSLSAKGHWVNADIITKVDVERVLVSIARITQIGC